MLFTDPTRTLRDQLVEAHAAVLAELDAFVAATTEDVDALLARWTSFEEHARVMMDAEEREVLPGFLDAHERDARAILREHHDLRLRAAAVRTLLERGGEASRSLAGELDGFVASIRAHTAHEQRLLYDWADGRRVTSR